MLLMVEKGIKGEVCRANTIIKIRNHNISGTGMEIIYIDGQCQKSCLQIVLSRLKIHLNLIKILQKTTIKIVMYDIFLKLTFNILQNYITFTMIYQFCLKE